LRRRLRLRDTSAPLDYRQAGGETIGVAVVRLTARDPARRIGTLLLQPGGPGDSGVNLVLEKGKAEFAALNERSTSSASTRAG
jgi:hypothetical protein